MRHIFISHASQDSELALKLETDLRNVGHEVVIDRKELRLGQNMIAFMNEALTNAHTVIILHSNHTKNALWQSREMEAAICAQTARGLRVIVLKVDNTDIPPLLNPYIFASLQDNYDDTFKQLKDALLSGDSATSKWSEAFKEGSSNPFWRVRAEYFEELPETMAQAFSPPQAARVGLLEEMKPTIIEGPRGSGKTMLLMSLRARILASRTDSKRWPEVFGFYLRLTRGAFCNAGITAINEGDGSADQGLAAQVTDAFSQEFFLSLIESLVSEVRFCVDQGLLTCDELLEQQLAERIHKVLTRKPPPSGAITLRTMEDICADLHQELADFCKRKFIYSEDVAVPVTFFDNRALERVIKTIKETLPELAESLFVVLLDEYENLFPNQKPTANALVKQGPPTYTIKMARKIGTDETSATTLGQELQEIHDYNRVSLTYSVEGEGFASYLTLLENITKKTLASQPNGPVAIEDLLPKFSTQEVDDEALNAEILNLCKLDAEQFERLSPTDQRERTTYYRHAAVFRVLLRRHGRRAQKRYAGFKDLAFLSSGVIRYFQEILGMAYHLETRASQGSVHSIDPERQSEAVHTISSHYLTTLSRNVERHGENLKYFVLDLGDCLRAKLRRHGSEPEAARIGLTNALQLTEKRFAGLRELLRVGTREGVFQTPDGIPGMRPKHPEDLQPTEFNIARVYAPVLQISARLRWRTALSCADLNGLCDTQTRQRAKSKLIRKLVKSTDAPLSGLPQAGGWE